jgi:hypothetical protein
MSAAGERGAADWRWPPVGARAVIATRHGKERAIAPALAALRLGWLTLPDAFDSDRFGTFTREIPRAGTQLAAARAKVQAALELCPAARIAITSEGAFGPDPTLAFVPRGVELVLMQDRMTGLELIGHDVTWDTNFAQRTVRTREEADRFAEQGDFPEHGLIMMSGDGERPLAKDITSWPALHNLVDRQLRAEGRCWLETDMRAYRNPRRMAAIGRAAAALAADASVICPRCRRPGFRRRLLPGRPCGWCKGPTHEAWREVRRCDGCDQEDERIIDPDRRADPGHCAECNP